MKIGIISDSHDNKDLVKRAVEIFRDKKVDYVLHAGDITSCGTAMIFARMNAKFITVFGNCDHDQALYTTIHSFNGEIHEKVFSSEIAGRKIYMSHIPNKLNLLAESENFDLIIYGHTHRPDIRKINNTLIINPGESTRRYTGQKSVVILDLETMDYEIANLDYVTCGYF